MKPEEKPRFRTCSIGKVCCRPPSLVFASISWPFSPDKVGRVFSGMLAAWILTINGWSGEPSSGWQAEEMKNWSFLSSFLAFFSFDLNSASVVGKPSDVTGEGQKMGVTGPPFSSQLPVRLTSAHPNGQQQQRHHGFGPRALCHCFIEHSLAE